MSDKLESLVSEYYRTSNRELVTQIYMAVKEYVDEWVRFQHSSLRDLSEEAKQDLSLTFVNHVIRKTLRTNVQNHIRNMINERAKHDRGTRIYQNIVSGHHSDIDKHVKVLGRMKKLLDKLPLYIRGSVMYLVRYPDQIDRFVRNNRPEVSYRVLKVIFSIRKSLNMSNKETELPESHAAKMLMLSNVYKHNPMALAVFLEVKSVDRFYQLCKLAERNELKLPSAYEFNQLLSQSLEIGAKLDSTEALTVHERQVLSLMVTNEQDVTTVKPSSEIVPVLGQYFIQAVAGILKSYQEVQDRIMATLDTSDPMKVKKMYEVLNAEVSTQVRMIQEIVGAINTSEAINKVLSRMESKIEDLK